MRQCEKRNVKCLQCYAATPLDQLQEHKRDACADRTVKCPNGCGLALLDKNIKVIIYRLLFIKLKVQTIFKNMLSS